MNTEYPKWKYGVNGAEKIVKSQEEESLLGVDWTDMPPAEVLDGPGQNEAPASEEVEGLLYRIAELEQLNAEALQKLDAAEKANADLQGAINAVKATNSKLQKQLVKKIAVTGN